MNYAIELAQHKEPFMQFAKRSPDKTRTTKWDVELGKKAAFKREKTRDRRNKFYDFDNETDTVYEDTVNAIRNINAKTAAVNAKTIAVQNKIQRYTFKIYTYNTITTGTYTFNNDFIANYYRKINQ